MFFTRTHVCARCLGGILCRRGAFLDESCFTALGWSFTLVEEGRGGAMHSGTRCACANSHAQNKSTECAQQTSTDQVQTLDVLLVLLFFVFSVD